MKKFFSSDLKKRGWSNAMIHSLLPKPIEEPNPYIPTKTVKFWNADDVQKIENSDAFKNYKNALEQYEKKEEIILANPADEYPDARKIQRHFILNVGATNTGKTYTAIQALKESNSGVYLAPLRLLAMEIQDRLLNENVLCSMTTGEEENIIPGAKIMSSTVEKLDIHKHYSVGVIDECQMIADENRGGAWTRAILGINADTIYLCMSPDAEKLCIKLIELCGDTYEVVRHERKIPLEYIGNISRNALKKHDAVILFTRKDVLNFAEQLKSLGLKASVVYGALPYKARKHQVEMYINGDTDIVVATDAIGMGMNLPIERVIFANIKKFDGKEVRILKPTEIKQIAGRAGRYGMFDKGEVALLNSFENSQVIKNGLETKNQQIKTAYVPFPESLLSEFESSSDALRKWQKMKYPKMFRHQIISPTLVRVSYLEEKYSIDKDTVYKLSSVIFDEKKDELYKLWKRYVKLYLENEEIPMPNVYGKYLQDFELIHEELDLYYSFHKVMGLDIDLDAFNTLKDTIVENVNKLLLSTNKKNKINRKHNRYCKICGRKLYPDETEDFCNICLRALDISSKSRKSRKSHKKNKK